MNDPRIEKVSDLYQGLHGSARSNPVKDDLMDVTTKEGLAGARALVQKAIDDGLINQAQLARRTGYKPSAISEFMTDSWKGSPGTLATLAGKLAQIINRIFREQDADAVGIANFVTTRAAEAIHDMAQYVCDHRQIGAFVMAAGMGKTMSMEALHDEFAGSILVTVGSLRATPKAFLQLWIQQLHLKTIGYAKDLQDRVINTLRGSNRLVLIDEAHKLTRESLDVMREIWDQARCPILLAATPVFVQTMTVSRGDTLAGELMDQLYSRVGVFRDMRQFDDPESGVPEQLVSVEDIRKMFCRGKVRIARDGVQFLCMLANARAGGGYRTCQAIVLLCNTALPNRDITTKMLREALNSRLGFVAAKEMIRQAEIDRDLPIAATA